jgi:DNA replication and repair protein RecF
MLCKQLSVRDFRNIPACDVIFGEGTNLIVGNNAQGKTNLLEAIALMALGKSFRGAKEADLIRFGQSATSVRMVYADAIREQSLCYRMEMGRRRVLEQNGVKLTRASEMIGAFRVVLFCPEHLSLIKSGPELRRSFLDVALCQLRPVYMSALQKYNKILKERNRLIKLARESEEQRRIFFSTYEVWSAQLAQAGAIVCRYRARYVERMRSAAQRVFCEMTGGTEIPDFTYVGSLGSGQDAYVAQDAEQKLYERLTAHPEREIDAGSTLYGPHRDDIEIDLNGHAARTFASQGQQRSLALAMKLSEGEICREDMGEYPVLLFDDVLSELDTTRREYLIERIRDKQVIMTTCEDTGYLNMPHARVILVENGQFTPRE